MPELSTPPRRRSTSAAISRQLGRVELAGGAGDRDAAAGRQGGDRAVHRGAPLSGLAQSPAGETKATAVTRAVATTKQRTPPTGGATTEGQGSCSLRRSLAPAGRPLHHYPPARPALSRPPSQSGGDRRFCCYPPTRPRRESLRDKRLGERVQTSRNNSGARRFLLLSALGAGGADVGHPPGGGGAGDQRRERAELGVAAVGDLLPGDELALPSAARVGRRAGRRAGPGPRARPDGRPQTGSVTASASGTTASQRIALPPAPPAPPPRRRSTWRRTR